MPETRRKFDHQALGASESRSWKWHGRPPTAAQQRSAEIDKVVAQMFNVKWCGDIAGIRTNEGELYLTSAIDLFSLRLLGYAVRGGNVAG